MAQIITSYREIETYLQASEEALDTAMQLCERAQEGISEHSGLSKEYGKLYVATQAIGTAQEHLDTIQYLLIDLRKQNRHFRQP